jgi:replicative DNA helicase
MRVKTHLDALDSIIGGFLPGLIYLGARPSIGKTTLATKIALNIGKAGGGVVFFSFEIGQRLLSVRLLSQAVDIPSESVMWGEPPIDLQRVNAGFNRLYNLPIHFAFRPRTVREMLQDCRQIQRQESLAAVFVDRLEIIPERKLPGETENNRLERISQDLNRMANELNIPLVVLL